jgi:hypothetical protein
MDKIKVKELARSYSLSCKKLVKDTQLRRTVTSPSIMLVSLMVINLVSTKI